MGDRSTDGFFNRVYDMVRQVPRGMVATYGQIAKLVGEPRRARYVGYALHVNPNPGPSPVIASYSPTDASRRGSPSADPRRSAHCSKPRALGFSRTDALTLRHFAGQRV